MNSSVLDVFGDVPHIYTFYFKSLYLQASTIFSPHTTDWLTPDNEMFNFPESWILLMPSSLTAQKCSKFRAATRFPDLRGMTFI